MDLTYSNMSISHRLVPMARNNLCGKRGIQTIELMGIQRMLQIPFSKSFFSAVLIPFVYGSGRSRKDASASPVVRSGTSFVSSPPDFFIKR